ncbi:hypothetical protein J1N35_044787 [Gossypium stocksii]|uniref:Uncharacterized protein n=1 Tax=Gossypium stocksii TaxID=47602 RepID=A0A9D3UA56_9ROSI|nr:hypothetical protein J1N35_044787 [Gossypium stocksii]
MVDQLGYGQSMPSPENPNTSGCSYNIPNSCTHLDIHPEVLATIENGDKGFDNDDQSYRDPNDDFNDPDLDDIPEDIYKEGLVEGENANLHSTGNTGPGIVIRNNPGSFMTDMDLEATFARTFSEYTNIVPAHLLDDEFDNEELFVEQQFDNKKGCLHVIKQLSLKLGVEYKVTKSMQSLTVKIQANVHELESHMSSLSTACVRANINIEQFIDEIYTLQHTLRVWGNEFLVIPNVSNWEVPLPTFEIVSDCSLHRHPKGRPQSMRIRNDMDVKETGEPKLCTVWTQPINLCTPRLYFRSIVS